MKKTLAAAAVVLTLTGCAVPVRVEPTPTPTPSPPTVFTAEGNSEFITLVLASDPLMNDAASMVNAIAWGQEACKAMDRGMTQADVALGMMDQGVTRDRAVLFTATAIVAMCPQHEVRS